MCCQAARDRGPFSLCILYVALGVHHAGQGALITWALGTNGPLSLEQQIQGGTTCPEASEPLPTALHRPGMLSLGLVPLPRLP